MAAAGAPTRLVTRRLTLHRARQADAPALAAVFASNAEFLRVSWACHRTFDTVEAGRYLEGDWDGKLWGLWGSCSPAACRSGNCRG